MFPDEESCIVYLEQLRWGDKVVSPFDPESIATTGNYYQGIDYFMMPNTRNFGFNIRLKF